MKLVYYAIRHKATGELMPQFKKDRGYSHWNPGNPNAEELIASLGVPRLLSMRGKAARCINQWSNNPNGRHRNYTNSITGEWEDFTDYKPDDRKKEDLEIVEVILEIEENV